MVQSVHVVSEYSDSLDVEFNGVLAWFSHVWHSLTGWLTRRVAVREVSARFELL